MKKEITEILNKDNISIFLKIKKIGEKYNIYLPREVVLHLRTITALNAISLEISPDFDIIRALRYFFDKYPLEKIEELTAETEYEEAHEEIVDIDEKQDWQVFREILVLEKERKLATKERFIEMLGYYAERYKELRSIIKKL